MRGILTIVAVLVGMMIVKGQDPHFSQFYASPLTLNPALTGAFGGNYRFSAIYREQWGSILRSNEQDKSGTATFRTYAASFDMRTNQGLTDADALGFGVNIMGDKAGAANFGTINASISLAYQKALNYDANQFLAIGLHGGVVYRTIDIENLRFGSQWDGFQYNSLLPIDNYVMTSLDQGFAFLDAGAGLLWYMVGNERFDAYLGASIFHVNTPDESFFDDDLTAELPMKYVGHGGIHFPLFGQVDLVPKFIVFSQGKSFETNFGTEIKYFFDPQEPSGNAFYAGLMYRIVGGDKNAPWGDQALNGESVIMTASFDYEGLTVGASYDINVSELSDASLTRGAFEVSAVYIGAFGRRKPKTVSCPRF
ncbi:MAG: PorP/SprF family type IX secretion system membrane protein [Chitinophagales bacterium]|nr:PorP/SprF family type IX secretion system membrane protein [Chitinophagales bacterium]